MPVTPTPRRRTIAMTEKRSHQVALAAAYLDTSGERFIQGCIAAALTSLAQNDKVFGAMIARAEGLNWDTLEFATRCELLKNLIIIQ